MMSRTFPYGRIDLGHLVRPFDEDGTIAALPGWRMLHTPGHTAGHVSLFRESDGTLLAGDVLATMNQESWVSTVVMERQLRWPPAPMTTDWSAARRSVERIAALRPKAIAAGHGLPMTGEAAAGELERFAEAFEAPADGRYVRQPARTDERGVVSLPPPIADPVGAAIRGGAIAAAVTGVVLSVDRARRPRRRVAIR
jgi:glyoxylase-like metal-dependent hydrolase (beta-lactamase superfamily II)